MKLIMKRNGNFKCNWRSADGKCGADTDLSPMYYYDCHIEAAADILDSHGFIVDQLEIDRYFQQRYDGTPKNFRQPDVCPDFNHHPQSCERIALNAVVELKQMIEKHLIKETGVARLHKVSVSIGFNNLAVMTAEWTPEKARADGRTSKPRTQV